MSGAMSSGGEQQPDSDGLHAQVAARLSDALEPFRTEHFPQRSYTIEDLVGAAETPEGGTAATVLNVDTTADEVTGVDIADQATDKPLPCVVRSGPHIPPLRHAEGGADGQIITPELAAWMQAEGLQRPPLYLRIQDTSPYADKPTLILPAFGAGPSIAHTVQAASDSRQGAVDALARGWSKLIATRRVLTAPDAMDAAPEPVIVEAVEQTAETAAAQPSADTQPENKGWGADQGWWQEAVVATQGTRARFFQQIQAAQPQLSADEAWRHATKQAYDDLRERCPDGGIVSSGHPWDREYMLQIRRVVAEREAALATLEPIRESGDKAAYEAAVKATQQQFNGLDMFNRAVAATNNILSTELDQYDTLMHQFRLDGEEGATSSIDLVRQVCEAGLIEDNAYRTILTVAAARGIEPSDVVNTPELEGERGSDQREIAAARIIAQGFARQVVNTRAGTANEPVPTPPSARELARPITPTANDRPVQPAIVRYMGRAWSNILAQRNERQVTFISRPPGSLRNPWQTAAADAAEQRAIAAAYQPPVTEQIPVSESEAEEPASTVQAEAVSSAPIPRPVPERGNMTARMEAFREHVAAVRAAREAEDYVPPAMRQDVADARVLYDETRQKFEAALTDMRSDLRGVQLDLSATHEHERAIAVDTQIEREGLTPESVAQQAARAAYFTASRKFRPDVLAKAGIEPMGVDFP